MSSLNRYGSWLAAVGIGLALTACGSSPVGQGNPVSAEPHSAFTPTDGVDALEVDAPRPRLAVTYAGGILVLDASTLEQVADLKAEGQLRLSTAGGGRYLLVAEGESFRVLDLGVWTQTHGDHGHSHAATPALTDLRISGAGPGHVVAHDDTVTLFFDGSGEYKVYDPHTLSEDAPPKTTDYRTMAPHHGVAMMLHDGSRIETVGTDKQRVGARVLDPAGNEAARSESCPGVHGEGVAAGDAVVFGCADGLLVFGGGRFTKIASPDASGRIGNIAATEASPVVLSDYRTSPPDKAEPPMQIALTDTAAGTMRLVRLPSSYASGSLGRGPAGEALVLGEDGVFRVLDPASGATLHEVPVIKPWTQVAGSQDPRPLLHVRGDRAYVTEPAGGQVHVVDAKLWKVIRSQSLSQPPLGIQSVSG